MMNPESTRETVPKLGARSVIRSALFNDFWNSEDRVVKTVEQLCNQGLLKEGYKGKLVVNTRPFNPSTPWFFIKHGFFRDCLKWHNVFFNHFGFVPTGCQNCWKCVVTTHPKPEKQYIVDLFRLRDMLVPLNLPSKVGMDIRDYTPARYDAFIYGESLKQAMQYWEIVSRALKDNDFPNGKVILKRGCTEMELACPDSSKWVHSEYTRELEMKLESIIGESEVLNQPQDDLSIQNIFKRWILRAYGMGDSTWRDALMYEGYDDPGSFLYKPPLTYHDKEPDELRELLSGQVDLSFLPDTSLVEKVNGTDGG